MALPPQWKGLFDWSMKYHDGTRPTDFNSVEMDPERIRWLEQALQNYMKDFTERMKEIKNVFDSGENVDASIKEKEALLEELQEIVESIDHARNFHKIGGLLTLLDVLECPHPNLRWRAAEVVATSMQNNPPVQKWFFDGQILPLLQEMLHDDDQTCRFKALLAVSSLIRNFKEGEDAFIAAGGMNALRDALKSSNPKLQRRSLLLLEYLLGESREHRSSFRATECQKLLKKAIGADDIDLRESVLRCLLSLVQDQEGLNDLKQIDDLKGIISNRQRQLADGTDDDREAAAEEINNLSELSRLLS